MTRLASANELAEVRERMLAGGNGSRPTISVCGGTGCRVYGSEQVWGAFRQELEAQGANLLLEYDIKVTGCHGFCEKGPLVVIRPQGILYTHVRVQDVPEIVRETILGGRVVERLLYHDPQTGARIPLVDGAGTPSGDELIVGEVNVAGPSVPDQACALGTAMAAAVVAGIYKDVQEAEKHMGNGFEKEYKPNAKNAEAYKSLFKQYKELGAFVESRC